MVDEMSHADWAAEGARRFGTDKKLWKFQCPICGNIATPTDFNDAGADPTLATQHCIGRHVAERTEAFGDGKTGKPCDYAAYGLFQVAPIRVQAGGAKPVHCFAFAN